MGMKFKTIARWAWEKGFCLERRHGGGYDLWCKSDHSTIWECATLKEAVNEIMNELRYV